MKSSAFSFDSTGREMNFDQFFPLLYQELFRKYCMELSEESFERFYHATYSFFLGFAAEKCTVAGMNLDPDDVVNRLYGILVSHASGRRKGVPFKSLFSWCFGTITNIVKEEIRRQNRALLGLGKMKKHPEDRHSPLNRMIQKEDQKRFNTLYNNVLRLIQSDDTYLSEREKQVMRLFYCETKSLRSIAQELGLKVENTAVILFRSRRRISRYFSAKHRKK